MHPNAELIKLFYTAFQSRDADGMNACYRSDVIFSDPIFGTLRGLEVTSLWRILCGRGKDLKIEFGDIHADEDTGSAHWEAWYTFSRSKRRVHNIIEAKFIFQDGRSSSTQTGSTCGDGRRWRWGHSGYSWVGHLSFNRESVERLNMG